MYNYFKKDTLVETEIVKRSSPLWGFCKEVTFVAASIRNRILYLFRQDYFESKKNRSGYSYSLSDYISEVAGLYAEERRKSVVDSNGNKVPPGKLVSNVGRSLTAEVKTFRSLMDLWYGKNHGNLTGRPRIPNYSGARGKEKVYKAEFNNQMISELPCDKITKQGKRLYRYVIMPKTYNVEFYAVHQIKAVTVMKSGNDFKLLKMYDSEYVQSQECLLYNPSLCEDNGNYLSIDLGVSNLITMVGISDGEVLPPYILSGRPLKSINRQCFRVVGKLNQYLDNTNKNRGKGVTRQSKSTHRIKAAWSKRKRQSDALLHEYTSSVVNYAAEHGICKIYVGYDPKITQKASLGRKNNQMFVSMCWGQIISQLKYKAAKYGILVLTCDESYTSKCSFLDNEYPRKHDAYLGSRVKRGLFRTAQGIRWNADVNAAWNILVKNNDNVSSNLDRNEVERFVVDPVVLIPDGFNRGKNDTASSESGCSITENRHELDLVPDYLS